MTTCMKPEHFPPNQQPETCAICKQELKEVEEHRELEDHKRTILETIERIKMEDQEDHVITYYEATGGQTLQPRILPRHPGHVLEACSVCNAIIDHCCPYPNENQVPGTLRCSKCLGGFTN